MCTMINWSTLIINYIGSCTESEYNAACTAGMTLAHFRMLVAELLNEYPDEVPKEAPLIILDSKSAQCMA